MRRDGRPLAATLPARDRGAPAARGRPRRQRAPATAWPPSTRRASGAQPPQRLRPIRPRGDRPPTWSTGRALAGLALAAFLIAAFGFAVAVSRSLQAQIARFLAGARRLAAGDFSTEVPIEGRDEFAALGEEFNKMSRQLESRLEELGQERARLEDSIRRIGETFASNLDRDGLLEIVLRTAVDAVGADCGRATARDTPEGPLRQRATRRASSAATARRSTRWRRWSRRRAGPSRSPPGRSAAPWPVPLGRAAGQTTRRCSPWLGPGEALQHARARPVQLPREPGLRLPGERRPARAGSAPGGDRRAHRPLQRTGASRRSYHDRGRAARGASSTAWD